jgi:hypothetical protein
MGSGLLEEKEMRFLYLPPSAHRSCVAIVALVEETVGFQSLRMRSFRNGESMLVESEVISRIWSV